VELLFINLQEYQSVRLALLHRGELIVDNFFLISGLLVAYILLQELPRKKLRLLHLILFRIIRYVHVNCVLYKSGLDVSVYRCISCYCTFVIHAHCLHS